MTDTLKSLTARVNTKEIRKVVLLDLVAFAIVFFVPVLAHRINFPVYMIEPMRLMVIISVAHSTKANSFLLAFTLSLFSYAVSGHPELLKTVVMTVEMGVNVFLFYFLLSKLHSVFFSMVTAIITSKVLCYALYLVLFSMSFLKEEAETSFLIAQVVTTLLFSAYVSFFLKKKVH